LPTAATADAQPAELPVATPLCRVRDLRFAVGGQHLLGPVDLDLAPVGCTVVLGPNGAGKTILLRTLHGLLTHTSGTIEWPGNGGARPRQAMVFQNPVMLRRSAWANVYYALRAAGQAPDQARAASDDVLQRAGLAHLARRPARVLSGGEQQRLAIARAWATGPRLLLLDEPTSRLDPRATHEIETLVDTIRTAGTRLLMTTHDLHQAERLADDVVFLHHGRVHAHQRAHAFFQHPDHPFAAAFLRGELIE